MGNLYQSSPLQLSGPLFYLTLSLSFTHPSPHHSLLLSPPLKSLLSSGALCIRFASLRQSLLTSPLPRKLLSSLCFYVSASANYNGLTLVAPCVEPPRTFNDSGADSGVVGQSAKSANAGPVTAGLLAPGWVKPRSQMGEATGPSAGLLAPVPAFIQYTTGKRIKSSALYTRNV
ncbi:hypothetical protein JZ751_012634 [Albula glossodonta]|uniref:Uncharacterized protein n=1 Tax=Albula glossodonta TaxID=121402 RepID=A0A8T2P3F6_9TELE|nr:hypothetical protein JZ751_012634 [Albula glossodonta]